MAHHRTVTETATRVAPNNAEWARIPKTGETLEGLFRSQLFALVKNGSVKTAAIKQAGAARTGMRLIHLPSLRQWIANHAEGGEVTA